VDEQNEMAGAIFEAMGTVERAAGDVMRNSQELGLSAADVARNAAEAANGTQEIAVAAAAAFHAGEQMATENARAQSMAMEILASAETTEQSAEIVQNMMNDTLDWLRMLSHSSEYSGLVVADVRGTATALEQAQAGLHIGESVWNMETIKGDYWQMLGRAHSGLLKGTMDDTTAETHAGWLDTTHERFDATEELTTLLKMVQRVQQASQKMAESLHNGQDEKAKTLFKQLNQDREQLFKQMDTLYLMDNAWLSPNERNTQ
jgi:hypothetical protein